MRGAIGVCNRDRVFARQQNANLMRPPFVRDFADGELQQPCARRWMLVFGADIHRPPPSNSFTSFKDGDVVRGLVGRVRDLPEMDGSAVTSRTARLQPDALVVAKGTWINTHAAAVLVAKLASAANQVEICECKMPRSGADGDLRPFRINPSVICARATGCVRGRRTLLRKAT